MPITDPTEVAVRSSNFSAPRHNRRVASHFGDGDEVLLGWDHKCPGDSIGNDHRARVWVRAGVWAECLAALCLNNKPGLAQIMFAFGSVRLHRDVAGLPVVKVHRAVFWNVTTVILGHGKLARALLRVAILVGAALVLAIARFDVNDLVRNTVGVGFVLEVLEACRGLWRPKPGGSVANKRLVVLKHDLHFHTHTNWGL